uniref:Uncharacterized protein n=1 Tax=viral metagenome TaxID=1070528 RepID=A0A6C0CTC8_9ZZZZ
MGHDRMDINDNIMIEYHGTAKRLSAVGAYTAFSDVFYIEVLADEHNEKALIYRLTTLDEAGYMRGTWRTDTVPDVILKIVKFLILLGSEVCNGILYGPHLARLDFTQGVRNLDIGTNLFENKTVDYNLHVDDGIEKELVWIERFLC